MCVMWWPMLWRNVCVKSLHWRQESRFLRKTQWQLTCVAPLWHVVPLLRVDMLNAHALSHYLGESAMCDLMFTSTASLSSSSESSSSSSTMIWCLTWGFASSSETDFNVCQSNHLAYIRMSGCKSIKYNYIFLQCNLVDPVQRSENWLLCLQTRQWVENTKHLHEFHLLKNVPFCLLTILWKVTPLPFRQGGETWDEHGECGRHQQRGKGGFKEIIITIIIIFNFDQFQNTRWFLWKHEIK